MAEEQKEETRPEPFYVGGEKIEGNSWGGDVVSRDAERLPKWVGNSKVERNEMEWAIKIGSKEIGRNAATGDIESFDGKPLDWRIAEKLRKYLDEV